jgi:hypothetical protein
VIVFTISSGITENLRRVIIAVDITQNHHPSPSRNKRHHKRGKKNSNAAKRRSTSQENHRVSSNVTAKVSAGSDSVHVAYDMVHYKDALEFLGLVSSEGGTDGGEATPLTKSALERALERVYLRLKLMAGRAKRLDGEKAAEKVLTTYGQVMEAYQYLLQCLDHGIDTPGKAIVFEVASSLSSSSQAATETAVAPATATAAAASNAARETSWKAHWDAIETDQLKREMFKRLKHCSYLRFADGANEETIMTTMAPDRTLLISGIMVLDGAKLIGQSCKVRGMTHPNGHWNDRTVLVVDYADDGERTDTSSP